MICTSLLFCLTPMQSQPFEARTQRVVSSMQFDAYVPLKSAPNELITQMPRSDLVLLESGQSRIGVSGAYDSRKGAFSSRVSILGGKDRKSDSVLTLFSFVAAVDRLDTYVFSSTETLVLTSHITANQPESCSAFPIGAPVVLIFQTPGYGRKKLLYLAEMLPGMSLAPKLTSGHITPGNLR